MIEGFEEIKNRKIKEVIKSSKVLNFPEFLTLLRQSIGTTRKGFSEDTNISEFLLFKWEHGDFKNPIKICNLVTIAEYYHVPLGLLQEKMNHFLSHEEACK
jgi:transcriptional regulator with XRE-family HTH domain